MYGASKAKKKERKRQRIMRDQAWQRGKALARILWKSLFHFFLHFLLQHVVSVAPRIRDQHIFVCCGH